MSDVLMSSFSKLIDFFSITSNDILDQKRIVLCNQNNSCTNITGDMMNNEFYNDIYISSTSYHSTCFCSIFIIIISLNTPLLFFSPLKCKYETYQHMVRCRKIRHADNRYHIHIQIFSCINQYRNQTYIRSLILIV